MLGCLWLLTAVCVYLALQEKYDELHTGSSHALDIDEDAQRLMGVMP